MSAGGIVAAPSAGQSHVRRADGAGSGPLRIVEIRDLEALAAIREPWSALCRQIDDDSPYLTPEFLLPWMRFAAPDGRCRCLCAWQGERLIGFAPLMERSVGRFGVRIRLRAFPLVGTSPPFDVLIAERHQDVVDGFLRHLGEPGDWDAVSLLNVPAASQTKGLLQRAVAGTAMVVTARATAATYYVPITASWEEFYRSRTRRFRKAYRYNQNCCERIGELQFRHYPGDGLSLDEALDTAFSINDRSWKSFGESRERRETFFRELVAELDRRGWLSLRILLVGGHPAAYLLEIDYRHNLHAFHIAYDLAYQDGGPGVLILGEAIRDAHERGYGRYDFGGTRDYLRHWSRAVSEYEELKVVSGAWWSRLKLRGYEWLHRVREDRAKQRTEALKNARKRETTKGTAGEPGATDGE